MAHIQLENVNFTYPNQHEPVVNNVSLSLERGEFLVIAGPSGCGKSTLLRLIKQDIVPEGEKNGVISLNGKQLEELESFELSRKIGLVFQDPDNQLVMESVFQELIFGLENLGLSTEEMQKRIAEMVQFFGIESLLNKKTHQLSGGQKQLINLASILLLQPEILLLDEPTSQLDPVASKEFITLLERLNTEFGLTIILVEHNLEEVTTICDRLMLMEKGRIALLGEAREVFYALSKKDGDYAAYLPGIPGAYLTFEEPPSFHDVPLTVKEGRRWLSSKILNQQSRFETPGVDGPNLVTIEDVCYRYNKSGSNVLEYLNLTIVENEIFMLLGGNGSGKSTLMKLLTGTVKPQRGKVKLNGRQIHKVNGKIGYLPQNPKSIFLADTIQGEWERTLHTLEEDVKDHRIKEMAKYLGLTTRMQHHPYDLSGGELQKAAIGALLLSNPELLLLDEPTKGMDPLSKKHFGTLIQELHEQGVTIVLVTHDIEFAANYGTRCGMLFRGGITAKANPVSFFKDNAFYTTPLSRMSRRMAVTEAVTLREADVLWR